MRQEYKIWLRAIGVIVAIPILLLVGFSFVVFLSSQRKDSSAPTDPYPIGRITLEHALMVQLYLPKDRILMLLGEPDSKTQPLDQGPGVGATPRGHDSFVYNTTERGKLVIGFWHDSVCTIRISDINDNQLWDKESREANY